MDRDTIRRRMLLALDGLPFGYTPQMLVEALTEEAEAIHASGVLAGQADILHAESESYTRLMGQVIVSAFDSAGDPS